MTDDKPNVDSIVLSALNMQGEELQTYLDRACGDDPALRARVELLLDAQSKVADFLESPAEDPGATALYEAEPQADAALLERPGMEIGPYKLLQQIGEGGFGVVYMAEQSRPVRRRVALKVIKPGMDTKEVIARFEAERQALALMDHPNIARVFDAGSTDSGRPYFVMELVKGIPLVEFCNENQLTPGERLRLFVTVCRAIQHAHQKGVIHRDLKPSNILVTIHDNKPVPKVIDFGVSKAISQQLTERTLFTAFGQMVGTPIYMSPEQAQMSGLDVDTRSDVYSLGVVLFELLTGTTPLEAERLRGSGYAEMQRLIREEEAPKPSLRLSSQSGEVQARIAKERGVERKQLTNQLRGDLDWIVMRALEKDRGRRYDSANSFADDLERFLQHEAVEACPPSAAYRFRKFARRHRASLAVTATIAALLIVGASVSTYLAIEATQAKKLANSETEKAMSALKLVKAEKARADRARVESDIGRYASQIRLADPNFAKADASEALQTLSETNPELRGWEYDRLQAYWKSRRRWIDPEHDYYCVDVAPDDRLVAGGSRGGTVRLFDLHTGASREVLQADGRFVLDLQFTSNGTRLVAATDTCVCVWDLKTRSELGRVDIRPLSEDEKKAYRPQHAKQAKSFRRDQRVGAHMTWETRLAVSRDGERIAFNTPSGIQVWNAMLKTRIREYPFEQPGTIVGGLDFSPRRDRLVVYSRFPLPAENVSQKTSQPGLGRQHTIYDTETGERQNFPVTEHDWIGGMTSVRDTVHVHDSGAWFAGAGRGLDFMIRDVNTAKQLVVFDPGATTAANSDLVGNRLALVSTDGAVFVYDTEERRLLTRVSIPGENHPYGLRAVALNSQGTELVGACANVHGNSKPARKTPAARGLIAWNMQSESAVTRYRSTVKDQSIPRKGEDVVRRITTKQVIPSKATWFAEVTSDRLDPETPSREKIGQNRKLSGSITVRVRSLADGKTLFTLPEKKWRVRDGKRPRHSIAGSPGGSFLARIFGDEVEVWQVSAAKRVAHWKCDRPPGWQLQLSPDGRYLATIEKSERPIKTTRDAPPADGRLIDVPRRTTSQLTVWDVSRKQVVLTRKRQFRTDSASYDDYDRLLFHPSGDQILLGTVSYEREQPAQSRGVTPQPSARQTTIEMIDVRSGETSKTLTVPFHLGRMMFMGDETIYFHSLIARGLWKWNLRETQHNAVLNSSKRYYLYDVSPDGRRLLLRRTGLTTGKSSSLILVEPETYQVVQEIPRRERFLADGCWFGRNGDLIFQESDGIKILHVQQR